jgi:hypothetical protein
MPLAAQRTTARTSGSPRRVPARPCRARIGACHFLPFGEPESGRVERAEELPERKSPDLPGDTGPRSPRAGRPGAPLCSPRLNSGTTRLPAGSTALELRIRTKAARPEAAEVIERVAYEADARHKIRVNRRRTSSSTWAPALQAAAQRAFRDQRGLLKITLEQHGISATVGQESVSRIVRILAALEHACETRGFLPAQRTHHVVIDGVPLGLHFGATATATCSTCRTWVRRR